MINKPFKDIDEQISTLRERNISISQKTEKKQKKLLLEKNYFNLINSYEDLFIDKSLGQKSYRKRTSLKDFLRVYQLDLKLSQLLYLDIHNIEVNLKTKIAYYYGYHTRDQNNNLFYLRIPFFSQKNHNSQVTTNKAKFIGGHIEVTDKYITMQGDFSGTFNKSYPITLQGAKFFIAKSRYLDDYNQMLLGLNNKYHHTGSSWEDTIRGANNSFVFKNELKNIGNGAYHIKGNIKNINYPNNMKLRYRYISLYDNPPIWIIVNTLTIGELKKVFKALPDDVQKTIINSINPNISLDIFEKSLNILQEVRNHIAHQDILSLFESKEEQLYSDYKPTFFYGALEKISQFGYIKMWVYQLRINWFFLINTFNRKTYINKSYKNRIKFHHNKKNNH